MVKKVVKYKQSSDWMFGLVLLQEHQHGNYWKQPTEKGLAQGMIPLHRTNTDVNLSHWDQIDSGITIPD